MTDERQAEAKDDLTLRAGQVVAGYRIERLLGKGGMATVWAATSERTGKHVALKATLAGVETKAIAAEMLRREALAASRINHPNVVNIYDVVEPEGLTCIVMEILHGEPLSAYLARKGFLAVEEAASLLLPAMRGVAAANALGVIHRDLKPKNLFICIGADGRALTTKVLDFGISVVAGELPGSPSGAPIVPTHGTPAYMSPEHIEGLADLDARVDVYGFGVIFFEALTGQLPFLGAPGPELLMRIVNDPAPRVTLFRPDLPATIADIVARALAKDPQDRFPNLDAFIAAVETHLLRPGQRPRARSATAGVPGAAAAPLVVAGAPSTKGSDLSDTRKLFALPGAESGKRGAAGEARGMQTDGAAVARPAGRGAGRKRSPRWARHVGAVVMFGGMLLLVAWLAFPDLPAVEDEQGLATGRRARPQDRSAPVPAATDLRAQGQNPWSPDGGG